MRQGQPSLSRQRRLFLALAAIGPFSAAMRLHAASAHDVRVIVGPDSPQQAEVISALRHRYGPAPVDDRPNALRRAVRPTAYLALGAIAFRAALDARLDAPVVCLFASRQAYRREADAAPGSASTAIYAEPAPEHQMRLIAALYKRPVAVGVLLSNESAHLESLLRAAAIAQGLRLEAVRVGADGGLTRSLNRLGAASALLIFPDNALYTQSSLRELLESTYRRRLPVIGFSAALVAAGTLASAYADIDDTLAQLDGLLDQLAARQLPPPRYPIYWRAVFNESVARSLDIVIDETARSVGDRP